MKALPALVVDVVAIVVFAILGRSTHDEANTLLGVLGTAWPFLVGALLGHAICWLVAPLRGDQASWRPGLAVWAGTLLAGLVLRVTSGDTAAWSFVLVAGVVLALFLLGWRVIFRLVQRTRTDAPV
ncbi:MAG TPA: DUF3054 domain-containing protein [Microlunatus sp.]|nr:DUF3054 domain-containing protein [Microlunatus sp.]